MAKNKGKKAMKCITVVGLAFMLALSGASLTGCSKAMQTAQDNIDYSVTEVLNNDEYTQQVYNNAQFSDFTFLCADVAKENNNMYCLTLILRPRASSM